MLSCFGIFQFVQRIDVGINRGDHNVRVRTLPTDQAAGLFQADRYLTLGIGTAGDIVDRVQFQLGVAVNHAFNGPE